MRLASRPATLAILSQSRSSSRGLRILGYIERVHTLSHAFDERTHAQGKESKSEKKKKGAEEAEDAEPAFEDLSKRQRKELLKVP
jgi:hypothetical protein